MNAAEFKRHMLQIAAELRASVEAGAAGLDPAPAEIKKRRAKAQNDFAFFCKTYFPDYTDKKPAQMHRWLYDELPKQIKAKQGCRLAIAAPRGHAKSTLVSQLFVLWCALTGRKKHILIIADAYRQAATLLAVIKTNLEANARLLMDFPKLTGMGSQWKEDEIVTLGNVKIHAAGSSKRLRGLRHGAHRPDLIIVDDLENDENVRNPEQRDKLEDWLNKTVLSLGEAGDSMDVIAIGTVLHYDSVLSRLLNHPLWQSKVFRAVINWPDNMDLWDRWRDILLNQGEAEANAFYQANQQAMNKGAEVCWPDASPLIKLMIKRVRDGQAAFDAEQQNDPVQGDNAPFANCIQYYSGDNPNWVYFGACDPSLGRKGQGRDPSAILIGGYDRKTGILDVIHANIKKRLPDTIIEDIIALQKEYQCAAWAIEAVQFQEFLRTELIKRGSAQGVPIPARPIIPNADKRLRIESLQPHIANGLIRLNPNQQTLIQQLKHFPMAAHDDGPDCLHMLWQQASGFASLDGATLIGRDGKTLYDDSNTASAYYGDFQAW